MKRVKILKNKLFIILCFMITMLLFDNFTTTQAKTPYVGDCFGENLRSDCLEEESADIVDNETDETSTQTVLSNQKQPGSLIFDIAKTLFALLLVLALIYVLIKFMSKRNKLFNQVKALENLGGISVGQNKSIQIVRIGEKFFIVGVGDNVELLQELDDEELINDLLYSDHQSDLPVNDLVRSIFTRKNDANDEPKEGPQYKFKNLFSNELEKLKENRLKIKNQQNKKED